MITSLTGEHHVDDVAEALDVLAERAINDGNAFYCTPESRDLPLLVIMVKESSAHVHYYGEEGGAGSHAIGVETAPGVFRFRDSIEGTEIEVPSDRVVPIVDAELALRAFATDLQRPANFAWFDL